MHPSFQQFVCCNQVTEKQSPPADSDELMLLSAHPITGRTHQIRSLELEKERNISFWGLAIDFREWEVDF